MEAYKMPFINFSVGIIVSSGFCLYKKPHNKDGLDIQGNLMLSGTYIYVPISHVKNYANMLNQPGHNIVEFLNRR